MRAEVGLRAVAPALALVALGCSVSQPIPKTNTYAIESRRPGAPQAGDGGVVRMHRFRVSPRYERNQFVYRTGDDSYEHDFYHQFEAPPGPLIREGVSEWLRASGLFTSVLDAAGQERADWLLEGQVTAFYADLRERDDPSAVIQLEITLLDARSTHLDVAFRKYYGLRVPAADRSPEALRAAWVQAMIRVLSDLEADLRGVVGRRG